MGEVKISNLPERGCAIGERGEECGVKREGVEMGTVGEGREGGEGVVSREVEVFQLLQLDKRAVIGHTHTHTHTHTQTQANKQTGDGQKQNRPRLFYSG